MNKGRKTRNDKDGDKTEKCKKEERPRRKIEKDNIDHPYWGFYCNLCVCVCERERERERRQSLAKPVLKRYKTSSLSLVK